MIKLIASDVDGTLLMRPEDHIEKRLFEQIRILKEHGVHFVVASGRQLYNLKKEFAPAASDISYIAENGSLCIHNGEVLARGEIERELALNIMRAIIAKGDCDCIVSCEQMMYTDTKNPRFKHEITRSLGYQVTFVDDLLTEVTDPILKIAVCDFDHPQATLAHFQDLFGSEIKVVTSGHTWVDFIAPNANKGTALETLADHLGIKPAECVAFGDQYNDVEMLEFAGISYAMKNAAPGMSYHATYIADSVVEEIEDIIAGLDL